MYRLFSIMKKLFIQILYKILSLIDNFDFIYIKKKFLVDGYKTIKDIDISNEGFSILTDTGYEPLTNLMISKPFEIYRIELENGYSLECADEHILFDENMNEIYVKDLCIGDFVQTDCGLKKIVSLQIDKTKISMCDTSVNHPNHRFYSNGILSHNSTTTAIACLWKILFNTDKSALILSKSGAAGVDLISKIKDMYMYLPYYLKCGTLKWNQSSIAFDNNSSISTEAFSPTAGLGKTINFLILDEFAWCNPNEVELFYNNIIPTVTTISDSNVCIMSTQNGFNLFYKIWKGAIEKRNIYAPFKVDWHQVPQFNTETKQWEKRTEKWKNEMIGILGSEEDFYYQYGTQFSASDKCLVNRDCLAKIHNNEITYINNDELILTLNHKKSLFWDPNFNFSELKTGYFLILIDLAEGGGGDSTVFNIFQLQDKEILKQVGRWTSNEVDLENSALEFWLLAVQLFNNDRCIVSIEWNTYGALFYKIISNLNNDDYNIETNWRWNFSLDSDGFDLSHIINYKRQTIEEEIAKGAKHNTSRFIPGIKFTSGNKSTACSLLKIELEKQQIIINDLITIGELENFEDKTGNGSYKAAYGHDDIIMTCCQIPMVRQTTKYKDWIEEYEISKTEQKVNSRWSDDSSNLFGFPFDNFGNGSTFQQF